VLPATTAINDISGLSLSQIDLNVCQQSISTRLQRKGTKGVSFLKSKSQVTSQAPFFSIPIWQRGHFLEVFLSCDKDIASCSILS
jgi:hypothetical protein